MLPNDSMMWECFDYLVRLSGHLAAARMYVFGTLLELSLQLWNVVARISNFAFVA